jgi:biopolymer transport protein ExbD
MYGSIVLAAKDNPYGVNIMPTDFTLNPMRSIRDGQELSDLYRLIASGVGGVMPAWVDGLKQEDLWAIAHYVHSLQQLASPSNRAELAKLRDALANQPPWNPPSKEPKKVTVGVDEEGKLTVDGASVEGSAALTAKLEEMGKGGQPLEVTIEATAEAKQEDIVLVLEVIKKAGAAKVAINQASGDEDDDDDEGDDDEQGGDTPAPEPTPEPKAPEPKAPEPKAPEPAAPKAPAPKAPAPKAPAPKAPAPKAPAPSDTPYD